MCLQAPDLINMKFIQKVVQCCTAHAIVVHHPYLLVSLFRDILNRHSNNFSKYWEQSYNRIPRNYTTCKCRKWQICSTLTKIQNQSSRNDKWIDNHRKLIVMYKSTIPENLDSICPKTMINNFNMISNSTIYYRWSKTFTMQAIKVIRINEYQ